MGGGACLHYKFIVVTVDEDVAVVAAAVALSLEASI